MTSAAERWTGAAPCAFVALIAYLWTASADGYWLDGGELAAAGLDLGVSHPPGHPLNALVVRLCAYLPLGPLALRVALASALCAAAGAAALRVALRRTLSLAGLSRGELAAPIGAGATLGVVFCHAYWFQAVRPEVYALQAALSMLILERALALVEGGARASTLAQVGLTVGLGLANHHLTTLLLTPVLAWPLWQVLRARRLRALGVALAAGALGLATYAYLPLRAAADPLPNLGAPTDLTRLWWVVSAKVYHQALGGLTTEPVAERVVDVAIVVGRNLGLVVVAAAGGAYVALRSARAMAWVWLPALVLPAVVRAALGFVRSNPDAAAFLLPSLAACAAFAAVLVGTLARVLERLRPRLALVVALGAAVAGVLQVPRTAPRASLASFAALDAFADPLRRDLPPRAVVVVNVPDSAFALWGGMAEEHVRPDLLVVPAVLLGHPGMHDSLARRAPELAPVLEAARGRDLDADDLRAMARSRPVLVEMDTHVPGALAPYLAPEGLYLRVLDDGIDPVRLQSGIVTQERAYARLYARLGAGLRDVATRHRLLWRHFGEALFYMAHGQRDAALEAVSRAERIAPAAHPLAEMRAALTAPGKGRIDVAPFIAALTKLR